MKGMQSFYAAAAENKLPGYQMIYEDQFGIVFSRERK